MTFLTRAMSQEIFNKIMTDFIECDKLLSALSYIGVTELEQLLTLPNDILDGLTMPFTDDNVDSYIPYFNKKKVKLVFCWLNKKWSNNLVPPTYEEWMALTLDDFNEFRMNAYNMFVFTKDFMTNEKLLLVNLIVSDPKLGYIKQKPILEEFKETVVEIEPSLVETGDNDIMVIEFEEESKESNEEESEEWWYECWNIHDSKIHLDNNEISELYMNDDLFKLSLAILEGEMVNADLYFHIDSCSSVAKPSCEHEVPSTAMKQDKVGINNGSKLFNSCLLS